MNSPMAIISSDSLQLEGCDAVPEKLISPRGLQIPDGNWSPSLNFAYSPHFAGAPIGSAPLSHYWTSTLTVVGQEDHKELSD